MFKRSIINFQRNSDSDSSDVEMFGGDESVFDEILETKKPEPPIEQVEQESNVGMEIDETLKLDASTEPIVDNDSDNEILIPDEQPITQEEPKQELVVEEPKQEPITQEQPKQEEPKLEGGKEKAKKEKPKQEDYEKAIERKKNKEAEAIEKIAEEQTKEEKVDNFQVQISVKDLYANDKNVINNATLMISNQYPYVMVQQDEQQYAALSLGGILY